jgi:hypothetical protein
MIRHDGELVARLATVHRSLETVSHNVDELLRRAAEPRTTKDLSVRDLRRVGHRLVSLAGDLTTLGVDAARWADELDDATDTGG